LEPGTTKNDDGREVSLTQKARDLIVQCIVGKRPDDLVFTREKGEPLGDFRKAWANACVAAGVGELLCPQCEKPVVGKHCAACKKDWSRRELKYKGLLFHDLRRTAVRNMVRAGVPERVAMTITGPQDSCGLRSLPHRCTIRFGGSLAQGRSGSRTRT
jgi:hypothetical protein